MSESELHLGISAVARTVLGSARLGDGTPCPPAVGMMDEVPVDAEAILTLYPEYAAQEAIVLDLAYAEFCQRRAAGEAVDVESFCRRFPAFATTLKGLVGLHGFLECNLDLVPDSPVRADWPEPGRVVEGFTIIRELGRGAFARAYLAEEIALGSRPSAIKISTDGAAEAEILGKLDHPNIVPVYSVRQVPEMGWTIVCMPYLGGVTLADVIDAFHREGVRPTEAGGLLRTIQALAAQRPPCVTGRPDRFLAKADLRDGAVRLGCQLADALAYSHDRGICHSDIKPSNVLLTPAGKPMLLDFNLAFDRQTIERRLGGTLGYMAPEQLEAFARPAHAPRGASEPASANAAVNHQSDVFSLGVILYELLAGRNPFPPVSLSQPRKEIALELIEKRGPGAIPLREVCKAVEPVLAELIERCLAQAPGDRPTAAQLAMALRQRIAPRARVRRWCRRHSRPIALAAGALVLVTGSAGYRLATRPPYAVRAMHAAVEHYDQRELEAAEQCFTRAIETDGSLAEAYFGRARTRQLAGQYRQAREDYDQASALRPAPEVFACRGYCWAMEGFFVDGIKDSALAIQGGMDSAEAYNNLGYSYLRKSRFAAARQSLDEALRRNPHLRQALHNRALTELAWATFDKQHPLDRQAGSDIELALEAGPPTAFLYLDAARIFSRLAAGPENRRRIAGYLAEALRLGASRETVVREFPAFAPSRPISDSRRQASVERPRSADHLADPLLYVLPASY